MSQAYLEHLFGLADQVAVVIGGTGVLGGALAEGLAQAGAKIVVAGRSHDKGMERVRAIENLNGWAEYREVDVAKRESIEALLSAVLERHGRVDMLINGAGVNSASPYLDVKDDDWDWVLASNLTSVHWGCQIFGRHMASAPEGGSILNIASVTSHTAAVARVRLLRLQGGRGEPDAERGPRAGPAQGARERALPRLLSGGAEPQDPGRRAGAEHHELRRRWPASASRRS